MTPTPTTSGPTGPGRYTDVPIATYHGGAGVSRSTLMQLENGSPLQCRWYMDNGLDETPAMRLGSMVDMLVYEPHLFASTFVVKPTFGRKKEDIEARKLWEEQHASFSLVTLDAMEKAELIAAAVLGSKAVKTLQGNAGAQESWYWEEEGTLCKTRPDGYDEKNGWTFDLKTTHSLAPRTLTNKIVDYGYDVQAATNWAAARALELPWHGHVLIWAVTSPPYDVKLELMEPGGVWLSYGLSRFLRLRKRFQECLDADEWPGFSHTISAAKAPKWVAKKLEDEEFLERAEAQI